MEIIKLNLIPSGVNPTCHCSQYDNGRVIRIDLFEGLTPYVLQSGDTVTLNVRKPDNTIVTTSLTATQGNTYVNLVTTEQICACVGYNLCDLTITNGSTVIGTLNFIMQVERDVLADGIPSQSVIEDLDARVAEAVGDNYYTKSEVDDALALKASASEVENIRVGVDGTVYNSAGDAVRGQIEDLTERSVGQEVINIPWEQGNIYMTTSAIYYNTSEADKRIRTPQSFVLNLSAGDEIILPSDNSVRMYIGWKVSTGVYANTGSWISQSYKATFTGEYYLLASFNPERTLESVSELSQFITVKHYYDINDISDEINDIKSGISDTDNVVNLCSLFGLSNGYINSSGGIASQSLSKERVSDYIPVEAGETYTMIVGTSVPVSWSYSSEIWRNSALYNSNKDYIAGTRTSIALLVSDNDFHIVKDEILIPSGAAYIRISARFYNNGFMILYKGKANSQIIISPFDIANIKDYFDADNESIALSLGNNIKSVNHAGWYMAPENTLPAYKMSKLQDFYYVETDISFTSDNIPVLLHDNTINRTGRNLDGSEISETINIYDITYQQSQNYDFGIYKGAQFAGTKLPTLEQFIVLCRNLGLHPYIELKSTYSYTQAQIESCYNIVKRCGMTNNVTWISFSSTYLGYIKAIDEKARLGFVVSTVSSESITTAQSLKTSSNEVFIDSGTHTSNDVDLCYNAGLPLEVWTIGAVNDIKNLDPYISGITSSNLNASKVLYSANISL